MTSWSQGLGIVCVGINYIIMYFKFYRILQNSRQILKPSIQAAMTNRYAHILIIENIYVYMHATE